MLKFHEQQGRGAVRTASAEQVTRPVYSSSIGRWKRYTKFLRPLFVALGPMLPTDTEIVGKKATASSEPALSETCDPWASSDEDEDEEDDDEDDDGEGNTALKERFSMLSTNQWAPATHERAE